ncbi:MAG: DUF3080 family protein [Halomonas sp. BM-2019]|nr:MAG: DUF3080 family protein [Halomonas sp. BM-2019]
MLAAALGGLLAACGGGEADSDALLIDYQRSLADRLDLTPPSPEAPHNIGAFPERRDRLVRIPETREGLFNVYALRECHITTLVAERNSALGRVAPASSQWRYELMLWARLEACLASEVPKRLGEADLERLQRLTATKTEQLPEVAWNGLFGSDEWAGSFSRVSSPLATTALSPPEAQLGALAYLQALTEAPLDDAPLPDLEELEGHLRALNGRPYTAELLRTLMLGTQRLEEASALIKLALARHDGCQGPALSSTLDDNEDDERLAAWLGALDAAAGEWMTRLDPLFDSLGSPPEAVHAYHRDWLSPGNPETPLLAFQDARDRHLALRRDHERRCGT